MKKKLKTSKEIQIQKLEEEASAQLTLFQNNQDDYAITRYQQIMEHVRTLRKTL